MNDTLISIQQELKTLQSAVKSLAKGEPIDAITLEPLSLIHIRAGLLGSLNLATAKSLLPDATSLESYLIAEGCYRALQAADLPAFGYTPNPTVPQVHSSSITINKGLSDLIDLWTLCGAQPETPYAQWDPTTPAYKTAQNHSRIRIRR